MIPLTVYYRRNEPDPVKRRWYTLALLFVLAGAAGAGSRSGLIGGAIAIVGTMVTKPGLSVGRRARVGAGAIVLAGVIGLTCLRQWPGLQQIFQLQRSWWERGVQHTAISYGITSLTPAQAGPAHLLRLRRGHWTIENRVHWSRDVTFGEDASQVRAGAGPDVLSVLRGAAITLLHHDAPHHLTARIRAFSQFPLQAITLVCRTLSPRA